MSHSQQTKRGEYWSVGWITSYIKQLDNETKFNKRRFTVYYLPFKESLGSLLINTVVFNPYVPFVHDGYIIRFKKRGKRFFKIFPFYFKTSSPRSFEGFPVDTEVDLSEPVLCFQIVIMSSFSPFSFGWSGAGVKSTCGRLST